MSDLTLSKQLGGRLKAISEAWQHENLSETLAVIFDAVLLNWQIPLPPVPTLLNDYVCRVRIKPRHARIFTQMSHTSGASVASIARSHLIQWLTVSTDSTHLLHNPSTLSPRQIRESTETGTDKAFDETLDSFSKQSKRKKTGARESLSDLLM
ncbi:hypothetical protein NIES267_74440 (plasmid) [Calothrix parasitica NIES-267]|uniref:Uncharacterized protein n=1 Tax=Calothrix parasitica NIES-267 TaxID=1973488 RepID=A0A1Z4M362_9CYAN|nr:hypothetical protein NIES267_74440 [Calothrix parasitica NIES-267]